MQFLRMSGYSKEEIIGRTRRILQGPESNPEVILYLNQIKKGLPFNCEIINYSKNKRNTGCVFKDRLYMTKGKIIKYFAIEEDVTLKRARVTKEI
jgi:PAS domain-containing protein